MNILVDFDSVVADLTGAQLTWMNNEFGTNFTRENVTDWDWEELFAPWLNEAVWGEECFLNEKFTIDIPAIWGALQSIHELKEQGHRVYIVSHRANYMWHWLIAWFDQRGFDDIFVITTETAEEKLDVARTYNMRVAVEDNPKTVRLLAESGQFDRVVIFDAPYNRHVESTEIIKRAYDWVEVMALLAGVSSKRSQKIALYGRQHAGKSSVSSIFQRSFLDGCFTHFALADDVKLAAVEMVRAFQQFMGMDVTFTLEELLENKDEHRWLLQGIGTNLARNYFGPDTVWIERFLDKVHEYEQSIETQTGLDGQLLIPRVICDDLRFPNEAEALRKDGFILVRVDRPEEQRLASLRAVHDEASLEKVLNHESEQYVDLIESDFVIKNDGDRARLMRQVKVLIQVLGDSTDMKTAA